ncbi:hypothetical protein LINPERHAP1_LOCUS21658 [Linum perenne]
MGTQYGYGRTLGLMMMQLGLSQPTQLRG